tara:strand:- start:1139 stop:2212 length:1074 start_codon:yes stop_codon:yes gene_type:complete
MLTFLNYILTPVVVLGAGFGAYYMYDPCAAHNTAVQWTWTAITYYVKLTDYFKTPETNTEITSKKTDDTHSTIEEPRHSLVYYVENEKNTYITDIIDETSLEITKDSEPLIMFIRTKYNDMTYFKRTQHPLKQNTEYATSIEKPFIQVELFETDRKAMDIHGNLVPFYVEGNIILDTPFLKWYMQQYYHHDISKEYSLKIIDKDVNMFTLDHTQHILIQQDGYKIVDNGATESDASLNEEEKTQDHDSISEGVIVIKDDAHWESVQQSGKKIVADFTATWCGPCQRIKPFFHMLSDDPNFSKKAIFVSCDVDECQDLAMEAGVSAMPTFQIWQNGAKIDETLGADENNLKSMIMKHL